APRSECDNIGAPLRPASALERDIKREQHFVKAIAHRGTPYNERCPRATARAIWLVTKLSERRKLSASGVAMLMVIDGAPPPCAATPRRPSGPRLSGMIASGPASPASPTPPAIGKYVGVPM